MSARHWFLVCYDVRDDTRLRRVARLLEGHGQRLQYSVFRCLLTDQQAARLRWRLTQLTQPEDDWLILPLCGSCAARVHRQDDRAAWPDEPGAFVVI